MTDEATVRVFTQELLTAIFENVVFPAVNVTASVDQDGDPIFIIHIVFEDGEYRLDPKITSALTGMLRIKLDEADISGFPIISFIARSDLGKSDPEAA